MKILFTGASSFTGYWFAKRLAERGHDVIATFTRGDAAAYGDEVRGERVRAVLNHSRPVFGCRFGDERFLEILKHEGVDLVCHHGSDATNYRSPDFDTQRAVSGNTRRIDDVAQTLAAGGRAALIWTGTVFETGEGAGSEGLPSISLYGESKATSAQILADRCAAAGIHFGKFVIPNPFGPWEEPRFTTYLMRAWSRGEVPSVRTPAYIRDNIHASLLAAAYGAFAEILPHTRGASKTNPSGYVESQGAFAERVAREVRKRTGWECPLEIANQTEFAEPKIRTNTEPLDAASLEWNESSAWDEFVLYYERELAVV
jgi:nucleoside-diphosphate-sugar epimerase